MCFQSPPKGETSNEETKDASAASASEPSSQEATPEKGKSTIFYLNIKNKYGTWFDFRGNQSPSKRSLYMKQKVI